MRLADARARVPGLEARSLAPGADAAALDRLAAWCERYRPWVASDGADAIRLDVSPVSSTSSAVKRPWPATWWRGSRTSA